MARSKLELRKPEAGILREPVAAPADFSALAQQRDPSLGQFFTPAVVADRMARLTRPKTNGPVMALDPGAGHGVLSWYLGRLLIDAGVPEVHVDAYEIDKRIARSAKKNLALLVEAAQAAGATATYRVHDKDFLREMWSEGAPLNTGERRYDVVIMNPPYYKIRKGSEYAIMAGDLIHGQPNVYALFLVLGARLLKPGGEMVAITPRSWLSGSYFRNLRKEILGLLDITDVLTFPDRTQTFRHHKVLQETIIFRGVRKKKPSRPDVHIEVLGPEPQKTPSPTIQAPWRTIAIDGIRGTIRIPDTIEQLAALRELDRHEDRLEHQGLTVSTGPVVAFRATEFMGNGTNGTKDKCPLIWIDNVKKGRIDWPGQREARNPRWISKKAKDRKLLVDGDEMILVRRFSAKEDRHRVIAAHIRPGEFGDTLGIENHVNMIRGFSKNDKDNTAAALTNFLNSDLVDQYLRACSGTTQINATDLRSLPIPPASELTRTWGPRSSRR